MASVFRSASVYFNALKVAEIEKSTYTVSNGNANQIGSEGVLGQSRGVVETKMEFDTVCPVQGHQAAFKAAFSGNATVNIVVLVDGGEESVDGTLTSRVYSSDSKTGECKGKFEFIGGEPLVI